MHRRGTLWVGGMIAMSGSSNHIAARLIHRAPREAGCPRSLALGDRGMIGKWPAHQPRRFTLSREKLCPVGVPFGSVGTIAMSGSSNHIAARLIHRAPREAGCPRSLALGDRGMIGKWPAHQPRRITLSRGKLCPVGVPFGSVGTIAMSGSSNPIPTFPRAAKNLKPDSRLQRPAFVSSPFLIPGPCLSPPKTSQFHRITGRKKPLKLVKKRLFLTIFDH